MKKTLSAIFLILGVSFMANAKTLVAYFSCTGNTKALSRTAAKVLDADLFEIEPAKPYTSDDLDWNNPKSRTSVECKDKKFRPEIKAKPDLSKYDTVVIAFPVWWYTAPNIIFSFVEQNDLSGKKVVCICTSGGSGIGACEKDVKVLASKKADFRNGKRFYANTSEAELKKFFDVSLK